MFERNVYDMYGLYCESRFAIGEYEGFEAGGQLYVMLPKEESMLVEQEMLAFTSYLHSIGDSTVLEPIVTLQKDQSALIDGQDVYVCQLPNNQMYEQLRVHDEQEVGAHLALVHHHGKEMQYKYKGNDLFGEWHKLWEVRLEQLEDWYEHILYKKPQSYVDEAFLFSYPYFMGLTECAIQYVVDTMIDIPEGLAEQPTICHRRFTDRTWFVLSVDGGIAKRPTEFVYDHPSRDLAEWIRDSHLREETTLWHEMRLFLEGYEQYESLTTYSWRLLYARLLFPLHYFEAIETYYKSQISEIREEAGLAFLRLLEKEHQNEGFLKKFTEEILVSKRVDIHRIPRIEWL